MSKITLWGTSARWTSQ